MTYTMNNTELEAQGFEVVRTWLLTYVDDDGREQYKDFVGTWSDAEDEAIWYKEHGFECVDVEPLDEDLEETYNEVKAEYDAEQAEELDMEFEDWMLNKYGPAWQVDTWAEVGADQEAYNEELQREFDEFLREREEQQEQEKTDAERGWRESETRCDLFTTWMGEDGVERQGFVHDTGYEVLYNGMWVTAYEYPDGKIYPELPPV